MKTNENTATKLTVKAARKITGHTSGLGNPSKMPGRSTGTSPRRCHMGVSLHNRAGSVCEDCYALKGRYGSESVQVGHERRGAALDAALHSKTIGRAWSRSMAFLINRTVEKGGAPFFRWHDAGDLWGARHLSLIAGVVVATPDIKHWLPTKEVGYVKAFLNAGGIIPENLNIRVSSYFIGAPPMKRLPEGITTSTVEWSASPHHCPAPKQGGICGDCRRCWDKNTANVNYHKH